MTYTFLSAQYANPEHTAAVAMTAEAAAVLLSQADTPAEWAAMQAAVTPVAYAAPPAPVPQAVTPLQARRAINAAGLRASIEAAIAAADQDAKDAWEYATEIRRDNALIASMAGTLGLTSAQIDDLFRTAATF